MKREQGDISEVRLDRRVATVAEHRRIVEAVDWTHGFDWPTVRRSLARSLFGVVAMSGTGAIDMGRIVGDGAMYFYVQNVAVDPA